MTPYEEYISKPKTHERKEAYHVKRMAAYKEYENAKNKKESKLKFRDWQRYLEPNSRRNKVNGLSRQDKNLINLTIAYFPDYGISDIAKKMEGLSYALVHEANPQSRPLVEDGVLSDSYIKLMIEKGLIVGKDNMFELTPRGRNLKLLRSWGNLRRSERSDLRANFARNRRDIFWFGAIALGLMLNFFSTCHTTTNPSNALKSTKESTKTIVIMDTIHTKRSVRSE